MPPSCWKLITRPFLQAPSLIAQPLRFVMDLKDLVTSLNDFASLSLAESWDNVGLLVEPSPPHVVKTLFLTNDLTEDVMQEALEKEANLILSYHPPIFHPLKRVTWRTWKERLVIQALENRVGIYSPHTTYDAIPNGVNDWLATGLGACTAVPLKPAIASTYPVGGPFRIEFTVSSAESLETVLSPLHAMPEVSLIATQPVRLEGEEQTRVSLNCSRLALLQVVALLSQKSLLYRTTEIISLEKILLQFPSLLKKFEESTNKRRLLREPGTVSIVYCVLKTGDQPLIISQSQLFPREHKPLLADTGMGRLCTLHEPASVSVLIERLKSHLKLSHVRLALGSGKSLESSVKVVALCAGSGASILQDTESDLYVTGEMSHHEVLGAVSRGISVILCEHSNTERGFLLKLQQMLAVHFMNKINIIVSERDRDPLQVV